MEGRVTRERKTEEKGPCLYSKDEEFTESLGRAVEAWRSGSYGRYPRLTSTIDSGGDSSSDSVGDKKELREELRILNGMGIPSHITRE